MKKSPKPTPARPARTLPPVRAMLRTDDKGFRDCEIADLNTRGVFVLNRDGELSALDTNTRVQLALRMNLAGTVKTHLLEARVTHAGRDGANLVFHNLGVSEFSALLHTAVADDSKN
jgi:hypothetical protein